MYTFILIYPEEDTGVHVSLGAYKIKQVKLTPKLVGPLLEHAEAETWI